jgi:hypothetical protein
MGKEANRSIADPKFDEPDQPILRAGTRRRALVSKTDRSARRRFSRLAARKKLS